LTTRILTNKVVLAGIERSLRVGNFLRFVVAVRVGGRGGGGRRFLVTGDPSVDPQDAVPQVTKVFHRIQAERERDGSGNINVKIDELGNKVKAEDWLLRS
jgi:hypothetical protein